MFDLASLKQKIIVQESTVECPVTGCNQIVNRQRNHFRCLEEFKCQTHGIYISPSTFEYSNRLDNILWKDKQDIELLNNICNVKRESYRLARDNSEDAVTWNVFRYLEKYSLKRLLSEIAGYAIEDPEIIYWSYCQPEKALWSKLQRARLEFETNPNKGSEPDLIVRANNALFFIEAKVNANNITVPSSNNPQVEARYAKGGDNWYSQVFNSSYREVSFTAKKYELMRFWLLGSWIAHHLNINFFLVNLVPEQKEQNIATTFSKYIVPAEITGNQGRVFRKLTWENVYNVIALDCQTIPEKKIVLQYLKNKSAGYDRNGFLQKTFTLG